MTREEAKAFLPIIQAFANGKEIEFNDSIEGWITIKGDSLGFVFSPANYRIKPEPKYRPFNGSEECWQEMLKHHPFGWLRLYDMYINIICVHPVDMRIELSPEALKFEDSVPVDIERMFISMEDAFNEYLFADGTPFGIKEE